MGYAVRMRGDDGGARFREFERLDDALAEVEQGAAQGHDMTLFREVPVEVRTVLKAVLVDDEPSTPPVAAAPEPPPAPTQTDPGGRSLFVSG